MKIKILDRISIGTDTPIDSLFELGEVECYQSTTIDELSERIADADVIIINRVKIDREALLCAKRLKLICIFATGYDNVDLVAARELGVAVCNVPAYSTDSVTVFTVATVLSLYTKLRQYTDFVRSGDYSRSAYPNILTPVFHDLRGKTWGIIGGGNIGLSVAKVAEAFGADILINKRNPIDAYKCVDLDTLCSLSDIITVHCPLTDETRNMINGERIALMKPTVVLVNSARGAVLDEEAVANAIKSSKIAAFGCDVYSTEPFTKYHPYYEIKEYDNVLLTPHAAWGSYEARVRCIGVIKSNITAFLSGKIQNRVDL